MKTLLRNKMKYSIALLITLSLFSIYCSDDNPVKPENSNPVIFSLVAFPEIVKPNDSLIVICNAIDPDGDTLVYDWYAEGIIGIKGLPWWGCCARFNTHENSQIFYAPDSIYVAVPQDTFRIEVAARVGKGGQVSKHIKFIVKQNIGGD
jgi:hypothetical protein